jgi:nitrogen regulatory protein PII
MTSSFRPALVSSKLITAILPKGVALAVIKKLRDEKNIITACMNFARGTGNLTPLKYRDEVVEREKEILTVVVDEAVCDEIFEYIYEAAEIDKPHGGVMYMHALQSSTSYQLPDISEETD